GKYSFILNQEVSSLIPLGYGVAFVRERFTPQCWTSRREFRFSRAPMEFQEAFAEYLNNEILIQPNEFQAKLPTYKICSTVMEIW
ncbi:hypothetical protein H5410_031419, partial [Solanum commersonii]